jgi:hypothetical protein
LLGVTEAIQLFAKHGVSVTPRVLQHPLRTSSGER